MIDESKILEYAQELIPEKEDDKPEEEVKEIIRRYLIEKGVTQHLTENQIRAIVRQYLIDEGILIPPTPDPDPEPIPGKLFPTLVIHSSSQDRSITVGNSKTYSIDVTSDGVLSVSSSSPAVATVVLNGNSITVTGIASGNTTISLTSSETANYYPAQISIVVNIGVGVRYGVKIDKNNSDPTGRVEYILDAAGFNAAHMDFANDVFDYGSWADKWFITDNKPLMLGYDGVVDYYLDPDDYSKKIDGTPSDVANIDYNGNAMAQIPLVWVYRYEDENYEYEIISNVQYDENYKAYAHTRADGSIADYFYLAMFGGSLDYSRVRSISGQNLFNSSLSDLSPSAMIGRCRGNGTLYDVQSWSQKELIRTLLVILGKITDVRVSFGIGRYDNTALTAGTLQTGTLNDKGQFYGSNNGASTQVKVFHTEGFWNDMNKLFVGLVVVDNLFYVKMTPEGSGYNVVYDNVTGYTPLEDIRVPYSYSAPSGYVTKVVCNEFGAFPITNSGSSYDKYYYVSKLYAYIGGSSRDTCHGYYLTLCNESISTNISGIYSLYITDSSAQQNCALTCYQPAA